MTHAQTLHRLAPNAIELPEPESVVEFAQKEHLITKGTAQGLWSPEVVPAQAEVLEAVNDPRVRVVTLLWGSQNGKSTVFEIWLNYISRRKPNPVAYVAPDEASIEYLYKERFPDAIESNPGWNDALTKFGKAITEKCVAFQKCKLWLLNAKSSTQLAQKSLAYIFADEIGKYPRKTKGEGHPLKQLRKRMLSYPNGILFQASTPAGEDCVSLKEYEASDQRELHVPCPTCGHKAPWNWDCIVVPWRGEYEKRMTHLEFSEALISGEVQGVGYVCRECGAVADESKENWMNHNAVWIAKRPHIKHHVGFKLPSLHSPYTTWRSLAAEFFAARHEQVTANNDEDMMDFFQHRLAEPFTRRRLNKQTEWFVERVDHAWTRNVIPSHHDLFALGFDVQGDGVWWWAESGDRKTAGTHGVDWGFDGGDYWDLIINRVSEYTAQFGTKRVRPLMVAIDSGDGTETVKIYRLCNYIRETLGVRAYPIKGQGRKDRKKTALPGGVLWKKASKEGEHRGELCILDVNAIKDADFKNLEDGLATFAAEFDSDKTAQVHMSSERRVSDNGITYWKQSKGPNHLRDARNYAQWCLIRMGLMKNRVGTPKTKKMAVRRSNDQRSYNR